MPKAARNKYYAVKIGREGLKIYDTWAEVSSAKSNGRSSSISISVQRKRELRFHRDLQMRPVE